MTNLNTNELSKKDLLKVYAFLVGLIGCGEIIGVCISNMFKQQELRRAYDEGRCDTIESLSKIMREAAFDVESKKESEKESNNNFEVVE